MSNDCIFCRLVAGELPAAKVYEDEQALAFMDINPVTPGHTLVIPKAHHDPLMATPDDVLQHLIITVRKVAIAQVKALGACAVNVTQANGALAGQEVPHIHFHVIPRCADDTPARGWTAGSYGDADEMEAYADKIRGAIGS